MSWNGRSEIIIVSVTLALTLGIFWFVRFESLVDKPAAMAVAVAEKSPLVRSALGEPLQFSRFPTGRMIGNDSGGTADIKVKVTGPLGKGFLEEWAQVSGVKWQVCSLVFRRKETSQSFVLVGDESTHCERE
jgi:hypothetical protein